MSATYTHAGVSRLKGEFKVRFANGLERVKVLIKNGHTDIDLVDLGTPMTKEQAIDKLVEINFANGNADVQAAIDEAKAARQPKVKPVVDGAPKRRGRPPKAKAEAATTEATAETAAEVAAETVAEMVAGAQPVTQVSTEPAPF